MRVTGLYPITRPLQSRVSQPAFAGRNENMIQGRPVGTVTIRSRDSYPPSQEALVTAQHFPAEDLHEASTIFNVYADRNPTTGMGRLIGAIKVNEWPDHLYIETIKTAGKTYPGVRKQLLQLAVEHTLLKGLQPPEIYSADSEVMRDYLLGFWPHPDKKFNMTEDDRVRLQEEQMMTILAATLQDVTDLTGEFNEDILLMKMPEEKFNLWKKIVAKAPILDATRQAFHRLKLDQLRQSPETIEELYKELGY